MKLLIWLGVILLVLPCYSMQNFLIPMPGLSVLMSVAQSGNNSTNAHSLASNMSTWVRNNIAENQRNRLLSCLELRQAFVSQVNNYSAFVHNLNLIERAIVPTEIEIQNVQVINPKVIEHHLTFLNEFKFLESCVCSFTKQFLIEYLNIVFDSSGNYIGIHSGNAKDVLGLFNNYLRTFRLSDQEHEVFLQKLVDSGNKKIKGVLDYHREHKSLGMTIEPDRKRINEEFAQRCRVIKNNVQVYLLQEVTDHCKNGHFNRAQALVTDFKKGSTKLWCESKECTFPNIVKKYYNKIIAQEDRCAHYMEGILSHYQEKTQSEIQSLPSPARDLYEKLYNVRNCNSSFERKIAQGITRALAENETAPLYREWVDRCYDGLLANDYYCHLLSLECNDPISDMQQGMEYLVIKDLLEFDQQIKEGKLNLIPMLLDLIEAWNDATAQRTTDSLLARLMRTIHQKSTLTDLSCIKDERIVRMLIGNPEEPSLVDSAVAATASRYEHVGQIPKNASIGDQYIISYMQEELVEIIEQTLPSFKISDNDQVRLEKYTQWYEAAVDQFKHGCIHIQDPSAQKKLYCALIDTITAEYCRIYKSFPTLVVQQLTHNITHPIEYAKGTFEGMLNLVKLLGDLYSSDPLDPFGSPQKYEKLCERFHQVCDWYNSLSSQEYKELWAQWAADVLMGYPFNFAIKGTANIAARACVFLSKTSPELSGLRASAIELLKSRHPIKTELAFKPIRQLLIKEKKQIAFAGIANGSEAIEEQVPKMQQFINKVENVVEKGINKNPNVAAETIAETAEKVPAVVKGTAQEVASQVENIAEKSVETQKPAGAIKAPKDKALYPERIPNNFVVDKFSSEVVEQAVAVALTDNKIHHIFVKDMHKLGPLVAKLGTQENVVRAIVQELQGKVFYNGLFKDLKINVAGIDVYIRGRMINGVPRIGTFFTGTPY